MKKDGEISQKLTDIREKALEELRKRGTDKQQSLSSEDPQSIIEELQVHQIELEMQNEELRAAQINLEESRSKFTDLYDFAPVGYFTLDTKGLILDVNLTGADMLGRERSSLIKNPFTRFVHRESQDAFHLHRKLVHEAMIRQNCEVRLRRKGNHDFQARLECLPVKDAEGAISQLRISVIDITQTKIVEERLAVSEAKYRMIFENSPLGILHYDETGKVTAYNHNFTGILGASTDKIVNFELLQSLADEDMKAAVAASLAGS